MAQLASATMKSENRSNRSFIWSWVLVGIHLVMAIDDLIVFVGRLQADGFFHKDTLIGLLFCSFQWHAILLILHHVGNYRRLHLLINKLLTFETTYYTKELKITELTAVLQRRCIFLGLACFILLLPSGPLYVLYFFHLSSVEASFEIWKDIFVIFCPILMTCTLLAALMLYFVVVEILTSVFENSHRAIGVDTESFSSGPSFPEMQQLKRNFFNLVDHARLCDAVFTWQNFVTICFATGNICLSVFTYIRMHGDDEETTRKDRYGFTPIMLLCLLNVTQLFILLTVMVCGSKFNGKARVLKHWLLRQDEICDAESKHAVDCLLWKLYDKDWGLTAGNFFLLDQGALLTTIGVIITYMTVLLQLGWQTTNMGAAESVAKESCVCPQQRPISEILANMSSLDGSGDGVF